MFVTDDSGQLRPKLYRSLMGEYISEDKNNGIKSGMRENERTWYCSSTDQPEYPTIAKGEFSWELQRGLTRRISY